jgi:hypothetical protein
MAQQLATVTPITASVPRRSAGLLSQRAQPFSVQTQPAPPPVPEFHPSNPNTYAQILDLPTAAHTWVGETAVASIKSRSFPRDIHSTMERVIATTAVPKMAGQVALINYGLSELDTEPTIIAHVTLREQIKLATGLSLRDQTRIDGAMKAIHFYTAAKYGVETWSLRCTEEFKGQLGKASSKVGLRPSVLAVVCMCRAMSEQPGVNEEAEAMLAEIYYDFIDAVGWVTDTISGGFAAACVRSTQRKPSA